MITVITSCHNSNPEYLRESINSILGQTYQDFEYLVADNGVWFDLEAFLKEFNDPRIKYIDNGGNIGPTKSYDNLADLAKGEYIAIQDHDDISLPDRLEVEKQALDNEPNLMSVSGKIHIFGKYEKDDGEGMGPERVKEELIFWQPIKQPTFMKRKSFCQEYKYTEGWFIYDFEFWSRTRKVPHRIIDKVVSNYRKSAGNSSKIRAMRIRADHALIVHRNLREIGINASIELCRALDPYNHKRISAQTGLEFTQKCHAVLNHISKELYEKKVRELKEKTV